MCKTIGDNIRETDYLARMGGDEFLLLLNTESFEKAKGFLDRLLKKIQKENNITISAGIAKLSRKTGTTELLEKSDEMMYAAKRAGKNRFFTAEDFQRGL